MYVRQDTVYKQPKKKKTHKERIMTDLRTRKDVGYVTEAMGRLEN